MENDLLKALQPPEEFPFPFQPYDIQKDFMRNLYIALERGCVGISESPTGTVGQQLVYLGSVKTMTSVLKLKAHCYMVLTGTWLVLQARPNQP